MELQTGTPFFVWDVVREGQVARIWSQLKPDPQSWKADLAWLSSDFFRAAWFYLLVF
jgi:hypothetical protein